MHDIFDRAQAFVAKWEGGLVDHPNDPGGITNRGVSLRWLRKIGCDIDGDGDIDQDDIRAVTPEVAAELFRVHFWRAPKVYLLPPLVAGRTLRLLDAGGQLLPLTPFKYISRAAVRRLPLGHHGLVPQLPGAPGLLSDNQIGVRKEEPGRVSCKRRRGRARRRGTGGGVSAPPLDRRKHAGPRPPTRRNPSARSAAPWP